MRNPKNRNPIVCILLIAGLVTSQSTGYSQEEPQSAKFKKAHALFYGEGVQIQRELALKLFHELSDEGHALSKTFVAESLVSERTIDHDVEKANALARSAFKTVTKMAESGNAIAKTRLGWMYASGTGVNVDRAKSDPMFLFAANKGYCPAIHQLAKSILVDPVKDMKLNSAFKWAAKGASLGDASCQFVLGLAYLREKPSGKNKKTAVEWLSKSAKQGHVEAMFELGRLRMVDSGGFRDFFKAKKWLTEAAEKGHAVAQNDLGLCYFRGYGSRADLANAINWFLKSAAQGNKHAQFNSGLCFMRSQQYRQALKYFDLASKQGHDNACVEAGYIYFEGLGVLPDKEKARAYWSKSARNGNAQAQMNLGVIYRDSGVHRLANEWFEKAAKQGHKSAQYQLGISYYLGQGGVRKDYEKAAMWLKKSADQNHPQACFYLAEMYQHNHVYGFSSDPNAFLSSLDRTANKAAFYYRRAIQYGDSNLQSRASMALRTLGR